MRFTLLDFPFPLDVGAVCIPVGEDARPVVRQDFLVSPSVGELGVGGEDAGHALHIAVGIQSDELAFHRDGADRSVLSWAGFGVWSWCGLKR